MVSLIGTVNIRNFLWANSPLFQDVGFAFYNYTKLIAMFSWVWIRWNKELKSKAKNPRLLWPFADVTKVYEQFVNLYLNRDINSQTALLRSFWSNTLTFIYIVHYTEIALAQRKII